MLAFYITLSLAVSFLCSLLEAVILSVSPTYLSSLQHTNPRLFNKVKDLKDDVERPLASILSFNTVAHTIGAAGAGAEAQKAFGSEVLTIFSILLTLAILFLSEIIPKSIGANTWRSLLPFSVRVLKPMIFLSTPLVYISQKLAKLFQSKREVVSREEINAIADIGLQDGVLHPDEHRALKGLVKFSKLRISDVIIPREKVVLMSQDFSLKQAYQELGTHGFSRVIVCGNNPDDIKGYVLRSDVQKAYIEENNKESDLAKIVKPILILPQEGSLRNLFHRLLKRREHISAAVDEYGVFVGIITLEDLIEKMLGLEIFDELDKNFPQ